MTDSPSSGAPRGPTPSEIYYASCPPAWATTRSPDRPTIGGRTANLARLLGVPLDRWQRGVGDTIGELDPATGRLVYPIVVLVVPRRAGKTLLAHLHALSILTGAGRRRGWYTLHRREIGAALWRDELFPLLDGGRLEPLFALRRSNGSETIGVRALGSTLRLFAPSGEALRSQNADVVLVDEAREFTLAQGDRLEAAVRPAQARRPSRQLIICSSAPGPDAAAEYLRRYRDLGRAAVDAGRTDGIAYFEWAAPPGLPYDDPATWRLGHPAIAAGQIAPEALAPDLERMAPAAFAAEYLGWWWDAAGPRSIDPAAWAATVTDETLAPLGQWWVALDVAGDRARAAVAVAGVLADGRVHAELVAQGAGATWALDTAAALVAGHRGARLVLDNYGPAANLLDPARRRLGDARVDELGTAEAARSCATLLDLIGERRLSHRDQPELDEALVGAVARARGDAWLWDRRSTPPEVCAFTWAAAAAAAPGRPRAMVASSSRR
jgi:hypothetical protein